MGSIDDDRLTEDGVDDVIEVSNPDFRSEGYTVTRALLGYPPFAEYLPGIRPYAVTFPFATGMSRNVTSVYSAGTLFAPSVCAS